jgi:hypothetical protein
MPETRRIGCWKRWGIVAAVVSGTAVLLALLVLRIPDPWPPIQDEDTLVQACGQWLKACNEARAQGEKEPPMPEVIRRLSRPYTDLAGTRAMSDTVSIFTRSESHASIFRPTADEFTNYFYVVYPLGDYNPEVDPRGLWPCKSTGHPRIFKTWRVYAFDTMTSDFVDVTRARE